MAQLRAAIDMTEPQGSLALYLLPNVVYRLDGAAIPCRDMALYLASDGEGATLDAQHLSRLFEVGTGARLTLSKLTLANGYCSGPAEIQYPTLLMHGECAAAPDRLSEG